MIIDAHEAQNRLPELLERAASGENITISQNGVPVAVLQPCRQSESGQIQTVIAGLRQFQKGKHLKPFSLREMIGEDQR
ncbi:MAG TPA: type II toxin-antitoxin system prevent-host-death family antitoxin [Chloroflexi bacterium]|nr:type II toxin-antitoxin system prevent-host-death family antitoxin [Chloroflexota bacterium]